MVGGRRKKKGPEVAAPGLGSPRAGAIDVTGCRTRPPRWPTTGGHGGGRWSFFSGCSASEPGVPGRSTFASCARGRRSRARRTCLTAWRRRRRAASSSAYWHSDKGLQTTRLRVSAWRAARKEAANVTHASAQKVGPPAIVAPRDTAPSAMEAGAVAVTREERSHEADRGGELARAEPEGASIVAEPQDAERAAASVEPARDDAPRATASEAAPRPTARGAHAAGGGASRRATSVVDVRSARPASRTRGASCPMTSAAEAARPCPIATIGTTLGRARCRQPARIERMKQSLATHGQLTPLVATARPEGVELVDGFKRLAAAETLGWPTLLDRGATAGRDGAVGGDAAAQPRARRR